MKTRDHFKAMGDVANANRLDQLAAQTKKDLKFIQLAEKSNLRVPKFHYETKPFTIVQWVLNICTNAFCPCIFHPVYTLFCCRCNTDLTDNDVAVTVVQGINFNVPNPKSVDTYVKLYFPYPTVSRKLINIRTTSDEIPRIEISHSQESPQQFKTAVIYDTNNPTYDSSITFTIQRNARACKRIFTRNALKCEIWSKKWVKTVRQGWF
jgi:coiled-coil and C2 domain-containing protein 1